MSGHARGHAKADVVGFSLRAGFSAGCQNRLAGLTPGCSDLLITLVGTTPSPADSRDRCTAASLAT